MNDSPSLPHKIQQRLSGLYGIDAPCIDDFIRPSDDGRERVDVRMRRRAVEIAVRLPIEALARTGSVSLDVYCQVVEGVSHFLCLVERARRELPTTQLELELQAEVDKFVIVSRAGPGGEGTAERVRQRLFFRSVSFLHPEGTERGDRYRLAHRCASRFVRTVQSEIGLDNSAARTLRRFFEAGQREKLEMVLAA